MEQLQAQLAELEAKKAHLFEQDSVDQLEVSRLNERIKTLKSQIDDATREKQLLGAHEERMEKAAVQITNAIESVDIDGTAFPLRVFIPKVEDYQMVLIHFNKAFVAQAEQFSNQILRLEESHRVQMAAKNEELNQEKYQNAQHQQRNAELTTALNRTEAERDNNKASSDDFEQKLKNAAAEIERLESHVDDLRQQIAIGVPGAIKVESTEDEAEKIRKWKESRKIYNVRWKDESKKTTYLANLLSTGEEIEIVHYAINSWTEVTAEEAERFRAEHTANQSEASNEPDRTDDISDTPLDVIDLPQVPSFPGQDEVPNENIIDGLDEGNASGEMVAEGPVTREEFKALKARVIMLENNQYIGSTFKSA